jgi:tripartite-type tricarboxylate transporter receptor subunit TctC
MLTPQRFCLFLAVLLLGAACTVMAQTAYPNRPVKIVVPWPPGGATDVIARLLGERLSSRLGQPFVIDNRAGATGQIGSQAVAQAAPDGYTLLMMSATVHSFGPNLSKTYPFDPIDDFSPVSQTVSFPYVMVVASNSPYNTVADLVAGAKKSPGKVAYGSFGLGSAPYLISELFAMSTGTQLLHVPYKGAAQALTDLAGGQITFFIDSLPSPLPQIRGGRLRALSVTTPARTSILPNVPTMGEAVPGFEAISWLGVGTTAKVPREILARLNDAMRHIATEPDYGAKLREIGAEPVASASPDEYRAFLVAQKQRWGDVVKSAKIPVE